MVAILNFRSKQFYSREEVKNRFSRWRPSRISNQQDFSYFLPTSHPDASYQVQERKRKIDFQDGSHNGHLGFPIRTNLAIFDVQVTLMLPTEFQVSWPFSSGEEVKNFQDGHHSSHLGFQIGMILAFFELQVT